ncbi:MAG: NAD-dependent epimerase/dehydratase family protein, partial [Acidimicrobiales bacterium]
MKILVTGGAGFIGANLCARLAVEGIGQVVALDDLSTGNRENLDGLAGVELVEGSVLDRAELRRVTEGAAAIVHLAALPSVPRSLVDPIGSHEANATGTLS